MDFELLPDLVLYRVFSFFDLVEKNQLERVCKRWLFLLRENVETLELKSLGNPFNRYSKKRSLADNSRFANGQPGRIKKLYVFGSHNIVELFLELAHLNQLEILKIESCGYEYEFEENLTIDLPNLCFLSIKNCFLVYSDLLSPCFARFFHKQSRYPFCKIRCPNLVYCVLPSFDADALVQVDSFEKIRYIKCDCFDANIAKRAVNLETLVCKRLELPFRLNELPKLKEIALFPFVLSAKRRRAVKKLCGKFNFEMALKSLRKQRTALFRTDLKVLVNGFEESIDKFFHLNKEGWHENRKSVEEGFHVCFTKKNAESIARNYDKIVRPLPFRTKVNYTNLISVFNGQIPANFFEKFPQIKSVSVSEQADNASDLLDFLQKCRNLKRLKLANSRYDQQFYLDLLRFQSLWHLIVKELSGQIDFSFILKLENLINFEMRSDRMPVETAYEFLKKRIRAFIFKKLNSNIEIKIAHAVYNLGNKLWIDGEMLHHQVALGTTKTMELFFSYLKKHEYRKFFI